VAAEERYQLGPGLCGGTSGPMPGDPVPAGYAREFEDRFPAFRRLNVFTQDPTTVARTSTSPR
jgi:hypothetical protein